jgi:osmotically-inducible protein OsmY
VNGLASGSGNDRTTDRALDHLEARIRCRLSRQIRDFRLLVHDNGVILQGSTQTYYAKQLAQHAVMAVTKLPILANQIEVP